MKGTPIANRSKLNELYPEWKPCTIWERFLRIEERFADKDFAAFDEEEHYSYRQVKQQSILYAKKLLRRGVQPGDHIGVMLHNCPQYVFLIFAVAAVGAVRVSINPKLGKIQIHQTLENSDVKYLIAAEDLPFDTSDLPGFREVIRVNSLPDANEAEFPEYISDEEFFTYTDSVQDAFSVSDILFTSGSTSAPKGVLETHDALLRNAYGSAYARCYEIGRRVFLPVPLYHIMAYGEGLLTCLTVGGTAVFLSEKFNAGKALACMKKQRVNDIMCMPITIQKLLASGLVKPEDFPDLHAAYWTNCAEWIWEEGMKSFGITDVSNGYGMSECASSVAMVTPEDPVGCAAHHTGRVKKCGPDGYGITELRICDFDTNEVLPAGERGEIQFRGPQTTKGYYNNPEATEQAFAEDGWFKSGDIGFIDKEGYIVFIGRKNDVYKINGENVSPQFLDSVISTCPGVKAVECVGIPDRRCGAVGVAFIDMWNKNAHDDTSIRKFCEDHLASFQVPKFFIFSNSADWPKTGSNKIQKAKLREMAAAYVGKME